MNTQQNVQKKDAADIQGNSMDDKKDAARNTNEKKGTSAKKRNKSVKLILLLVVLALLIGGTVIARSLTVKKEEAEEEEPEKAVVFSLTPDEVTALSFTNDGDTLSFTKTDGTWALDGTPEFPLNQNKVAGMLSALETVTAEKTIESKDVSALSEYGLEEPVCSVEVDGKQLLMGSESDLDGYLYVSNGDGNVYLTYTSLRTSFDYDQDDLIQNETIPAMNNLTSFTVKTPDTAYEIDRIENSGIAYSDEYEYFMKNGNGYITLGTDKATAFIEKVTQLGWNYCVDWNADDELLESAGLADPPITVTVKYTETYTKEAETTDFEADSSTDGTGNTLTDSDGNPVTETIEVPKEFTLYVSGGYARIKDSRMVYYIGEDLSDALTYTSVTELMPEEVLALDFSDVISADVTCDGTTYSFEKISETQTDEEGQTTIVTSWKLYDQATDFADVTDTIRNMLSYGYAGMYPADGDIELSLLLHRTSESHPETELTFRRYDSTYCIALVDGQPTVLIYRTEVADLVNTLGTIVSDAKTAAEEATETAEPTEPAEETVAAEEPSAAEETPAAAVAGDELKTEETTEK